MREILKIEDLIGKEYGRLTIIEEGERHVEPNGKKQRVMVCQCSCGNTTKTQLKSLRKGEIKSCGCLLAEQKLKINEGDKYNSWTVLGEVEPYIDKDGGKHRRIEVECICGNKSNIAPSVLVKGKSKSCGCQVDYSVHQNTINTPIPPIDLEKINKRDLGDWVVTKEISAERNEKDFNIVRHVEMKCKCGYKKVVKHDNINRSKSCPKCAAEKIKSKFTEEERLLRAKMNGRLGNMVSRCYRETDKSYISYGAKGVTVCDEWRYNYNNFFNWCIEKGLTLENNSLLEVDRIDNTKGYNPDNCQLITKVENNLKTHGLTIEDIKFIRSEEFNYKLHRNNYKCSDKMLQRIIDGKTFREI